jgi:phosphate starvation-inducible protein PhoH and related proteins
LIGEGDSVRLGEQVLRALYAETAESVLTPEALHLALQESGVEALLEQVEDRLPDVIIRPSAV